MYIIQSLLTQPSPHTVPLSVSGLRSRSILLEGENTEIGVRVQERSYPISFHWSYNGSPFSGNDRVRVVPGTGSLAVVGADSTVEGEYALTIASRYQSVQVATTVQVICKSHDHLQCVCIWVVIHVSVIMVGYTDVGVC